MKYYLRTIDLRYWKQESVILEAKTFADFRTGLKNDLSVFEFDDTKDNINDILLGIIFGRQNLETLGFIKIDSKVLSKYDIDPTTGKTLVHETNQAHRDIKVGSADNLFKLAQVLHKDIETTYDSLSAKKVEKLFVEALKAKRVEEDKLNPVLKKKAERLLAN